MTDDRTPFREARAVGKAKHHEQRLARAQVRDGKCPFCGSEVIPMHEMGKEGPQRLICCRLIPHCGAQFELTGEHITQDAEATP